MRAIRSTAATADHPRRATPKEHTIPAEDPQGLSETPADRAGIPVDAQSVVSGMGAPPVVAVVITKDPGDWFEATLESLAEQDYEQLSILVVDNASAEDPTPRVAEVVPDAFVKRVESDQGFSFAANEGLRSIEGAPFLLICHDDARLARDVVTQLVAEAFRANAGIVGAKLVDWDDSFVLRSVGLSVDPYAASAELVDPGELDQSQHDIARPVFAVSDACMLVRADLFVTTTGFNDQIPFFGEEVDLCWRAQAAGASVQFCPRAVVAHRGAFDERRPTEERSRLELRHQARMMMSNWQFGQLWRVLPAAGILSVFELLISIVTGRGRNAADVVATWAWVLTHPFQIMRDRKRVKAVRRPGAGDHRSLMRRGSTRLRALLQRSEAEGRVSAMTRAGRDRLRHVSAETTSSRLGAVLAVVTLLVLVVGARSLVFADLPSMREFTSAGNSVGDLFSEWWTGWRASGLGEAAVPPGMIPGLGVVGTVLFASVGAARRLLVVLPLFLGPIGAWRLFGGSRSMRARAACVAVYGLSPIALNAMGEARLQALVAYAAAPWVLRRTALFCKLAAVTPEGHTVGSRRRHVAGTALILALVTALSPLAGFVVTASVMVMLLGPASEGRRQAFIGVQNVLLAFGGALIVNAPWILAALRHGDGASLTGLWEGRSAIPSAADMLSGSVGSIQTGLLGWGVVVAAAVPLFTGRSWRFGWSVGAWLTIVVSLGSAVLAARADLVAGAGVEIFLVPAVLGLAVGVAMAPLAFEQDVVRSDFGSRQVLSFLGVGALLLGLLPVVIAGTQGRWYLPQGDFDRVLHVIDDGTDFRTLWIGDPDVLPMSGWAMGSQRGVNIAMSQGMTPVISQRFRLDGGDGIAGAERALTAAFEGRTSRLGAAVAPMAVRYVVVVNRPAPEPFAPVEVAAPRGVVDALEEQLDLSRITVGPGIDLFEVSGTWPTRSDITELPRPGTAPPATLGRGFGTAFSGTLRPHRRIAQAVTGDPGWSLSVGAHQASRSDLFSWSQQFRTDAGGNASLRWSPPFSTRLLQLWQLAALVALMLLAWRPSTLPTPTRRRQILVPDEPIVVLEGDDTELEDWSKPPSAAEAAAEVDQ